MGELLAFPGRSAGGDAAEGERRESAPSAGQGRSISIGADPAGAAAAADDDGGGARWAVPGVDGAAPAPEPTRASRRAENVALASLTRHDASEGEIRARLVAKGVAPEEVEVEIERLLGAGLLDDTAFAVRQVERLRERKGLGDSAVRSALRGRLVPQDVIDVVLAEQAEDEDDAAQRLQEVADDRARRLGSLAPDVAERRLIAYLMRKGYGGSAVRTAARAALGSADRR